MKVFLLTLGLFMALTAVYNSHRNGFNDISKALLGGSLPILTLAALIPGRIQDVEDYQRECIERSTFHDGDC